MSACIYKTYDQEALDRQYNNRAAVPDFEAVVKDWSQRSQCFREHAALVQDVRYGSARRERLDIFPAEASGAPILLFLHGGYWQAMDKRVFHFTAEALRDRDVMTVLADYPLAPADDMTAIVTACRRAAAWLYRNGAAHGGDPERIFVSGHSAGGHLTAMLMATPWPDFGADLPRNLVKGGCAVSGLFDLEPIRLSYLNKVLCLSPADVAMYSPVRLTPATSAPLIAALGALESAEYHDQSRALAAAWSEKGTPVAHLIILPGDHHFSVLDRLTDPASPLLTALLRRMGAA